MTDNNTYFSPPSYDDMIDALGHTVLADEHHGAYAGDSAYALMDASGRVGFLVFGWGSCSGCDALAACSSDDDVRELTQDLADSVVWSDDPWEFISWVLLRDWDAQPLRFGAFAKRVAVRLLEGLEAGQLQEAGA